ncbi:MAG: hypothetical protein KDK44_04845 [Chlamydiia bacterium]|nr:hypothetical protein [Chlamydiia bacterium]MCP5509262.1 hypothetical protein [Chlamydiales bacterium]HPE84749.1 C4-type zinc ribbon domain-containing protein [Chlamydiales bacterium]
MLAALKTILEIQELDIKMIQLMRVKRERQRELRQIEILRQELQHQLSKKTEDIKNFSDEIKTLENALAELCARIKTLEARQSNVKKIDEFNALTQEMTAAEREKASMEQQISDLTDKRFAEEEVEIKLKESLVTTAESSKEVEDDIRSTIAKINAEGQVLKAERDKIAEGADQTSLKIYERLINNKKDRVVVPLENRTCAGCHIALTPQHENLVRRGENLVFCEHCSRIHFWQQESDSEDGAAPRRRRRRATV